MDNSVKERKDIPLEYTWRVEDIFASDEAWEKAYAEAARYPEELASFAGKLGNAADLLEFFNKNDESDIALSALYRYASMKNDEDTTVGKYTEMVGKAYSLYVATGTACAFFTPELLSLSEERISEMYGEEPKLCLYRRAIDMVLKRKPHTLSEREERLLAMASEMGRTPGDVCEKLSDADLKFPDVDTPEGKKPLTQGSYAIYRIHPDREVRADAFRKLHDTFGGFENTYAATLDGQVKQLKFFSDARSYTSTLEAALTANEVPTEVYHNLIATVRANLDKMDRYAALRRELMALDELHMYDLYVPIVADSDLKVPYDTAKANCLEAVKVLGEEYCQVMKEGFDNRWVDVYENKGKRSGAYSSGARPHPFVLMNYADTLDSEFTLIHEMGHSLHSYLSKEKQPTVYSDYVIFVAEVASTCNEVLLMKHLLSGTEDKRERAYLINYFLEQFRTTLFRQTMFAEFELKINEMCAEGITLTAENLNKLYYDLNCDYYGRGVTVDPEIAHEWARIPHFYYDYYVYQYATGFSAAVALAEKILDEGQSAANAYLEFLSGGCSEDPISLLRKAGVDMASPEPIEKALGLFGELIDELRELLA